MTTLVTGGSKCGKSHFAEKLFDGFEGRKFYIATMQPDSAEKRSISPPCSPSARRLLKLLTATEKCAGKKALKQLKNIRI